VFYVDCLSIKLPRTHCMKTVHCSISNREIPIQEAISARNIRGGILQLIKKDYPGLDDTFFISQTELNKYRNQYLELILKEEIGELSTLEKDVLSSISENELIASNLESEMKSNLSIGDQLADKIATFGGSWTFIISFFSFILAWMAVNIYILATKPFDPFPFILLNLILSCLAAIQAPIIMMSQNRQEDKDRKRAEHDYKVNLKAELEIRLLHEKVDHLLMQQNQRLMEVQQLQIDLLENIVDQLNQRKSSNEII